MELTEKNFGRYALYTIRTRMHGLVGAIGAPAIVYFAVNVVALTLSAENTAGVVLTVLAAALAGMWLTFSLTRWHLRENGVEVQQGELGIFGSYVIYCLALMLLYAIVWIGLVLGTSMLAAMASALPQIAMYGVVAVFGLLVIVVGGLVMTRFSIAMPAVAAGKRPNIMNQMADFAAGHTRKVFWVVGPLWLAEILLRQVAQQGGWGYDLLAEGAVYFQTADTIVFFLVTVFTTLVFTSAYIVIQSKRPIEEVPVRRPDPVPTPRGPGGRAGV